MSDKLRNLIQAPPRQLRGNLAAATSVEPSASASEIIRVAGASSIRVRGQFSKAGVLRVELVRHNQSTLITDPAAAQVPVVANVQAVVDLSGIVGEFYAKITYTAVAGGVAGTVTFVDIMQNSSPSFGLPPVGSLAAGESIVLDMRGFAALTIAAAAGATVTVSRVDSPFAAAASGDAWDNESVGASTLETFPVDYPFMRVSTAGGACTWARTWS